VTNAVTRVVNKRHEPYDVYIGKPGPFGNPFWVNDESGRAEAISNFEAWFLDRVARDLVFRDKVLALKGKTLGCFCKPKPCHGDVIQKWLDGVEVS
jgi:hypothetical protein